MYLFIFPVHEINNSDLIQQSSEKSGWILKPSKRVDHTYRKHWIIIMETHFIIDVFLIKYPSI